MAASSSTKKTYRIATIAGDGIGIEVVDAAVKVLNVMTEVQQKFMLDFEYLDWSSENYLKRGYYIPEGELEMLKKHDAILFGAVGSPGIYNVSKHR